MTLPALILASTSPYRRELLARLRLPFEVQAPDVDESRLRDESPRALASRLALAKARAVAQHHPEAVVIGSDQVLDLDGEALGKPGDHANATAQLQRLSGRKVRFHTAVAVVRDVAGFSEVVVESVTVRFRHLTGDAIERYLRLDMPYDCAGSAKVESLGIALLASVESNDPTALVGLPLITTCELLCLAGIDPLGAAPTASGVDPLDGKADAPLQHPSIPMPAVDP